MKKTATLLASFALALLAGGCGGQGSSADFPADFKAASGDASAVLTWTAEPGVDYWIFYGPGEGITTTNWSTQRGTVVANVKSPRVVTGLVNGSTYSFTINGRKDGGPGGPGAPTQVVVPRLAGADWAPGAPLGSAQLNGIAVGSTAGGYANVAVGANGAIFSSLDGAATTQPTNPAAAAGLNTVWYGPLGFMAAGGAGTLLHSPDATTWTAQTSGTTSPLYGGAGFSGYVAVGANGTVISSSTTTSWSPIESGTTNHLYSVTYGNGRHVAVGANGTIVTPGDGVGWVVSPSGTASELRGVAYAALSTTSGTQTTVTHVYVAVGAAGTVLTSNDGKAWTPQAPLSTQDLTAIVYGGQFVAVGKGGVIFTSPDGLTWQARNSGTQNDFTAVARTLSGYTAVGAQGTNVSSF